jgi:acyl carrier protein
LAGHKRADAQAGKGAEEIQAALQSAGSGRARQSLLAAFVKEQVAQVMRLPASKVDANKPLRGQGMDSLMTIEFRNLLETKLGIKLSATLVWNYPTVNELVSYLAEKIGTPLQESSVSTGSIEPTETTPAAEDALGDLSQSEVEAMLANELDELDDYLKESR